MSERAIKSNPTFCAPVLLLDSAGPQPAGPCGVDTGLAGTEASSGESGTLPNARGGAGIRIPAGDAVDLASAMRADHAASPETVARSESSGNIGDRARAPQLRPGNRGFRKFDKGPRLSAAQAQRQGDAARAAWEANGRPGAAIAFLNTFHDDLGGRPIDLAIESDAGLLAVRQAIGSASPPASAGL